MTTESDIFDGVEQRRAVDYGFGDFKLLKTTAYASLYIAVKSGKRFLVKTTKDKSEWQMRLLIREYELALNAEHPHIVHVYTLEEVEPYGVAMVMEYVDGRTLDDYLAERPSLKERERIFDELLLAVEYLHKRGVVHNDIKPDNILVSYSSNTLKLIDFGLADSDAEYALRTLGCTPRYASPELRERGKVDARSDIYSLGVVMTEMFGASRVARRAMQDDPARRYANVAELRSAWHRSYGLWWWLGVVAIVAVVIGVIFTTLSRQERDNISPTSPRVEDSVEVDSIATSADDKVAATPAVDDVSRAETFGRRLDEGLSLIARQTADSIAGVRYREFAYGHLARIWERGDSLYDKLMSEATNDEERIYISSPYEHLMRRHYAELSSSIEELPSVYMDLEGEEQEFYDRLLRNNLSYCEYTPEHEIQTSTQE